MSAQPLATDPYTLYLSDLWAYTSENLYIRTKAARVTTLRPNRAQRIVHDKLSTQLAETGRIRAIILKARQEGISTYTAARFYRRVTMYENQNAMVIADQRKRGQTLFKIYEMFDRKLPPEIKPAKRWQRRGWNLDYDNMEGTGLNSHLTVETAMDAAAGRGDTIQAIHASELAFWENPEVTWISLMQAVPDAGSEVIIESTANGVGNFFHQMWEDAEAGDSSFIPIFLPWWIHEEYAVDLSPAEEMEVLADLDAWEEKAVLTGFEYEGTMQKLSPGQIEWRRRTIKDKLRGDLNGFKQEYPSTAREAFLVSGDGYFDADALELYEAKTKRGKRYSVKWKNETALRVPAPNGELRVWHHPKERGEYVIFADTATGRKSGERDSIFTGDREQGGRDFSAAWVYDVQERKFCALIHGRIPPETFADKLHALGFLYSHPNRRGGRTPALLGVERNHSSGETVVRRLKDDLGYPNLYFDHQMNKRRNRMTPAAGWITTEAKRAVMLDEFSAEIRQQSLELLDPDTVREMYTFVRGDDGKPEAQEGCHDDRVIAASGCIQMARFHYTLGVPFERKMTRVGGSVGRLVDEGERHAVQ